MDVIIERLIGKYGPVIIYDCFNVETQLKTKENSISVTNYSASEGASGTLKMTNDMIRGRSHKNVNVMILYSENINSISHQKMLITNQKR